MNPILYNVPGYQQFIKYCVSTFNRLIGMRHMELDLGVPENEMQSTLICKKLEKLKEIREAKFLKLVERKEC